jgi:hypothetical protein
MNNPPFGVVGLSRRAVIENIIPEGPRFDSARGDIIFYFYFCRLLSPSRYTFNFAYLSA